MAHFLDTSVVWTLQFEIVTLEVVLVYLKVIILSISI